MKIDIPLLQKILIDAQFHGFNGDEEFSILNVAHLKEFENQDGNVLYFVVYEDNPEKEGWYINPFDRSKNIASLKTKQNYYFLLDKRVPENERVDLRYIYVENIFKAIETIKSYVLSCSQPLVVGVTGSVGKTTTAGMIEDVVKAKYKTKRIYSKRLTPLTLSSWIINFIETDDEVIVLEYSMYRPHHIAVLAEILSPDYAIFLNVEKMHLGVRGIDTLEDIVLSKQALTKSATSSILNADDPLVMSAARNTSMTFSLHDKSANCYVYGNKKDTVTISCNNERVTITAYIKTVLFLQQVLATCLVAEALRIDAGDVGRIISEFSPEENRIKWIEYKNRRVLFDADVTISARLKALAENTYKNSILFIAHINFGEENVMLQVDEFNNVFSLFSEVRVIASEHNMALVKLYQLAPVVFVNEIDVSDTVHDFIVIHYGTYFRLFKDVDQFYLLFP